MVPCGLLSRDATRHRPRQPTIDAIWMKNFEMQYEVHIAAHSDDIMNAIAVSVALFAATPIDPSMSVMNTHNTNPPIVAASSHATASSTVYPQESSSPAASSGVNPSPSPLVSPIPSNRSDML